MNKTWLVIKHEYLRHVLRKRFILALLSVPLFVAAMVVFGILAAVLSNDSRPAAIIDQAGFIQQESIAQLQEPGSLFPNIKFNIMADETAAKESLSRKKIQAYFLIPQNYAETGQVMLYVIDTPSNDVIEDFQKLLQLNILSDQSPKITERILEGPNLIVRSSVEEKEFSERNFLGLLVPILSGVLFIVAINTSGGYLLQAVVEEKENRTMEIVITSLSPEELMAGKIIGNLSVGLTQLIAWVLTGFLGIAVMGRFTPEMASLGLNFNFMWIMLVTFLPAFIMVAALMAMVGATATEAREAQQIAGLFTLPIVAPFYFIGAIMNNPNSPLAIGLSLFPLTAPMTLPMRTVFTTVPTWQLIVSIGLLVFFAVFSVWLAARAFRIGMLRYGKRLKLRELFRKTQQA